MPGQKVDGLFARNLAKTWLKQTELDADALTLNLHLSQSQIA